MSAERSENPRVSLALLDGWKLDVDRCVVAVPHHAQRLLAFVALHADAPRDLIAGRLWPEVTEARAHGNLRSTVWRVHRMHPGLVAERAGRLSLRSDVAVDVADLICAARQALAAASPAAGDGPPPCDLLGRELLPGWYDDWVLIARERLRQLRLHALERLAVTFAAEGRFVEALETAMAAVAIEPLRESAHRTLIDVHLGEGNASEAFRVYDAFCELLARELGLCPSERLTRALPPRARRDRVHPGAVRADGWR